MSNLNKTVLLLSLVLSPHVFAQVAVTELPQGLTLQGRIIQPDGLPLESNNVFFNIKVLSPGAEECVLFEENRAVNMTNTKGVINFVLGASEAGASSTYVGHNLALHQLLKNTDTIAGLTRCASGDSYSPQPGDTRRVRVSFTVGSEQVTLSPDFNLRSVPYAMEAESAIRFGGKTAAEYLVASPDVTQARLETLFLPANFNALLALVNNPSSVTSMHLAPGSVTTDKIPDGAVQNSKIADGAITFNKLANNAVTTTKIVDSAVTSAKILDGSISTVDIGNAQVTDEKISTVSGSKVTGNIAGQASGFYGALNGDVTGAQGTTNVVRIQGRAVAATAPASQQVLKWNGSAWAPANTITSVSPGTGLVGGGSEGNVSLGLSNTGVGAGWYGSTTTIPRFYVDSQGRITSVSNQAVAASGAACGGTPHGLVSAYSSCGYTSITQCFNGSNHSVLSLYTGIGGGCDGDGCTAICN